MRPFAILMMTVALPLWPVAAWADAHTAAEEHDEHDEEGHAEDDHGEDAHDDHAQDDHGDDDSDHLSEAGGVRILHGWAQATDGDVARIFMDIENGSGAPIRLVGGEAEIGGEMTVMAASIRAGGDPMVMDGLEIADGSELILGPEGVFLLMDDLAMDLEQGDSFDMHVMIEPVGEIDVYVEVEAANARQHSHAGHDH